MFLTFHELENLKKRREFVTKETGSIRYTNASFIVAYWLICLQFRLLCTILKLNRFLVSVRYKKNEGKLTKSVDATNEERSDKLRAIR